MELEQVIEKSDIEPAAADNDAVPNDIPTASLPVALPATVLAGKIAGVIVGFAFGDAVAQCTKLMPAGTEVVFPRIGESRGLAPNDWGYATDHMMLTMQSITTGVSLSELLIKFGPRDEPAVLRHVIESPGFAADSCGTANDIWEKSGRKLATSAAMCRAVACGLTNDPVECAYLYTAVTHADTRCQQAAVVVALIIGGILHGVAPRDILTRAATFCTEPEIIECVRADLTIEQLELDVRPDYITRALSCAIYALRIVATAIVKGKRPCIKKIAFKFAAARGHSDVNTGIVCAIIGAYVGVAAIPEDLIDAMPRSASLRAACGGNTCGQ